jgi:hypothetical protein
VWKRELMAVLLICVGCGMLLAAGQGKLPDSTRQFVVNQGQQLQLQVPSDWVDVVQGTSGAPFTVTFRPNQGNRFLARFSISWDEQAGASFNTPGRLREIVLAAGSQMMPHAVEKQLSLREIKGAASQGYYLPLTVKAPRPGDFEIMTQGAAALGPLMVVFTYQGHSGGDADLNNLLAVIRGARLVKAQPAR